MHGHWAAGRVRACVAVQLVLQGVLDLALQVGGDVVPARGWGGWRGGLLPAARSHQPDQNRAQSQQRGGTGTPCGPSQTPWFMHDVACACPPGCPPVRNVADARQRHALGEGLPKGGQLGGAAARQQLGCARVAAVLINHPLQGPAEGGGMGWGGRGGGCEAGKSTSVEGGLPPWAAMPARAAGPQPATPPPPRARAHATRPGAARGAACTPEDDARRVGVVVGAVVAAALHTGHCSCGHPLQAQATSSMRHHHTNAAGGKQQRLATGATVAADMLAAVGGRHARCGGRQTCSLRWTAAAGSPPPPPGAPARTCR